MKRSPKDRRLLARLKSLAWSALAALGDDPQPVAVAASDGVVRVRVECQPADAKGAPSVENDLAGSFLSPLEMLIVKSLADGPLAGKAIARATGQSHDTGIRVLLHNLRARGVVGHGPAGYHVNRKSRRGGKRPGCGG